MKKSSFYRDNRLTRRSCAPAYAAKIRPSINANEKLLVKQAIHCAEPAAVMSFLR